MKKILLSILLIITFFTACSQPNKLEYYQQNPNHSKHPLAWQELLLLPDEFMDDSKLKHFEHPAFLADFQTENPSFVNLKKFRKELPKHELSQLRLWYSASFFKKPYIMHYMIMEFQTGEQAQDYVSYLKSPKNEKLNKILRYKNILLVFSLRNFKNKLIETETYPPAKEWIDKTIKKIMEHL